MVKGNGDSADVETGEAVVELDGEGTGGALIEYFAADRGRSIHTAYREVVGVRAELGGYCLEYYVAEDARDLVAAYEYADELVGIGIVLLSVFEVHHGIAQAVFFLSGEGESVGLGVIDREGELLIIQSRAVVLLDVGSKIYSSAGLGIVGNGDRSEGRAVSVDALGLYIDLTL